MSKKKSKGRDDDDGVLVWSSGPGGSQSFGVKGQVKDEDGVAATSDQPPAEQKLKVTFDKKGRRGKAVTLIRGFQHTKGTLEDLARRLKQQCGAGGSLEGATVLIQVDHRDRIVEYLKAQGYKVTLAGK